VEGALFENEPLMILKLSVASWLLTLNFILFRGIAQRLPLGT
jgi:hypothetical protein